MIESYEKAILALSNYVKYYGMDTEDEIAFKEYFLQCKRNNISPLKEVDELLHGSAMDRTLYCIPLLQIKKKLRTTIEVDSNLKCDNEIIDCVGAIVSDPILYDGYEIEIIDTKITYIESTLMDKLKKAMLKKVKVDIEIDVLFSNKIQLRSDSESEILENAISQYGFIGISKAWKEIESHIITNKDHIIVTESY